MIVDTLEQWLAAGGGTIGQISVQSLPQGYELTHVDDRDSDNLTVYEEPEAAHRISKNDAQGEYRPLKTASSLVPGWRIRLKTSAEVLATLDIFYPAAIGMWARHLQKPEELRVYQLMETLERQTGMYRYARTISEAGRRKIVDERCHKTCLRRILWDDGQSRDATSENSGEIPIFCPEICNHLVADARVQASQEHSEAQKS